MDARQKVTVQQSHDHEGHRQRLRRRLEAAGLDALADYEVLEFLLGLAIRGRDVKPLAKQLLSRFGGLGRLLDARREEILEVHGAGPSVADALLAARAASVAALADRAARGDVVSTPRLVADYCRLRFAGESQEVVAALLVDSRNRVLRTAILSRGTVDRAAAFPREVAKVALEENAASVILTHNHPSGHPEPSTHDISLTREVEQALKTVGVRLLDHLVVGREGHTSLKEAGVI